MQESSPGWWGRLWPALLLLGLAVAYFLPPLLDGRLLAPGDGIAQYFPMRVVTFEALKQGQMPFWLPHLNSGTPLLANLQGGTFFPGNWTFFVLPAQAAMNASVILGYWLAGLGTYAFCRAIALPRVASLVGAIAFMGGGFLAWNWQYLSMLHAAAFFGFQLWAIERFRQTLQSRYAIAGAFILALQILAGHPQMTVYNLMVALPYAAFRGAALLPGDRLRYAGQLALMLACGIGLSLLQMLPTLELIQASQRSEIPFARLALASLPLQALPTLVFPFLYGVRETSGLLATPQWAAAAWSSGGVGYVGIATLTLAAGAIARIRKDGQVVFWAAVAAFALLLALGDTTPFYAWWTKLPVMNKMQFANRHLLEFNFAVAVLAALGLSAWSGQDVRRASWMAMGLVGAGLLAMWIAVAVFGPRFVARTQPYLPSGVDLTQGLSLTNPAFWLPGVFFVLTIALLVGQRRRPALAFGLLLLLALDLGLVARHLGRFQESPHLPAEATATLDLTPSRASGRTLGVTAYDYPYFGEVYPYLRALRYPDLSLLMGVPTVNGFDAFILRRYGSILRLSPEAYLFDPGVLADPAHHGFDLVGLRRLHVDPKVVAKPDWKPLPAPRWVRRDDVDGMAVFENIRALPSAWRPARATVLAPEAVDARVSGDVSFAPLDEALVESAIGPVGPGTAVAETVGLNRIRVTTAGATAGLVVVSESYDPGWTAFAGGRALPVRRVDGMLLGVEVPGGAQVVELLYEPRLWKAGLAGTGAALVIVGVWGYLGRRSRA